MISNWALFCINFRIYWTATFTCCFQNPMSWYKWLTRLDTVLDPQHHCRKSLKKIHKVNVELMSDVTVQPMLVAGNFQNPFWFTLSCVHGMNMTVSFRGGIYRELWEANLVDIHKFHHEVIEIWKRAVQYHACYGMVLSSIPKTATTTSLTERTTHFKLHHLWIIAHNEQPDIRKLQTEVADSFA